MPNLAAPAVLSSGRKARGRQARDQGKAASLCTLRVVSPLNFFSRACGTVWMVICIVTACILVAAFGMFSSPVGLPNSPLRAPALVAGAYVPLALYATLQLWTKPQYTTLFLVTAVLPLFFIFILPPLALLSR